MAAAVESEPDHTRCADTLRRGDLQLVVPTMVVAEASYLINRQLGPVAESQFLHGLQELEVEAPHPADWERIAELVYRYRDLGLGGTDAATVALAERLGAAQIITLDRRHFSVVRPAHTESFELLPA